MSKTFEITDWMDKRCFTVSYKEPWAGVKKGVWLYHDVRPREEGITPLTGYEGMSNEFKGVSNITHEEIFKKYPEVHDRYLKELIKRI